MMANQLNHYAPRRTFTFYCEPYWVCVQMRGARSVTIRTLFCLFRTLLGRCSCVAARLRSVATKSGCVWKVTYTFSQ